MSPPGPTLSCLLLTLQSLLFPEHIRLFPNFPFYRDMIHIRLGLSLMTSFQLDYLGKDPLSKQGPVLRMRVYDIDKGIWVNTVQPIILTLIITPGRFLLPVF